MANRNLHFPPEVRISDNASHMVKKVISEWRQMPLTSSAIGPRDLIVEGCGNERSNSCARFNLPSIILPTGFLFRVERNSKFLFKTIMHSKASEKSPDSGSSSPCYASVIDRNGHFWTSTTYSVADAVQFYGARWDKHSDGMDSDLKSIFGVELLNERLLFLAIDPSANRVYQGLDRTEIALKGKVPVKNIYILNDYPELVQALVDAEIKFANPMKSLGQGIQNFNSRYFFRSLQALVQWSPSDPMRGFRESDHSSVCYG